MNQNLEKIRLVVFDLDGTLVNSFTDIAAAVNHVRGQYQMPLLTLEDVMRCVGDGIRNLVIRTFNIDPKTDENGRLDKTIADVRAYYREHVVVHTRPYDGVPETLAQLKDRGLHTAVLSNKPNELTVSVAQKLGLDQWLDHVQGYTEEFPIKPTPDSLLHLMDRFGANAADTLMVGDGPADIQLAENSGVHFCAVTYGLFSNDEMRANGVTRRIARMPDLLNLLAAP